MTERRKDDLTAVTVEYAIYLKETRGTVAGLTFARNMKVPSEVADRITEGRLARKTWQDRRSVKREG